MTVTLQSIGSLDWKTQNAARVVNHILEHMDGGDVILLHDVYDTPVDAALQVADVLTKQGYTFATVEELLID